MDGSSAENAGAIFLPDIFYEIIVCSCLVTQGLTLLGCCMVKPHG